VTVENRLIAFTLVEFLTIAASGSPDSDSNLLVLAQFGISFPSELKQKSIIIAEKHTEKHKIFEKRSYGGGGLSDALSGNGELIAIEPLRGVAEYIIGSMVVAYSRVRAVVCLVVRSARGLSQH